MNIMKNKKRLKGDDETRKPRINIIDIAVIVVFVFLALLAVEYFTSISIFNKNEPEKLIEYTLEFDGVSSELAQSIATGDMARGNIGSGSFGTVKSVTTQPQVKYIYDPATKSIVAKELPLDAYGQRPVKLVITLQASAVYTEELGYAVNGTRISIGTPVNVSFEGFSGNGNCVSIQNVQ